MTVADSPRQEVRRLHWIMRHVVKLSPAGTRWLRDVLIERDAVALDALTRAKREAKS